MMNHTQYVEWLQLYLYDELAGDDLRTLEQHLRECPLCREELTALKQFKNVMQGEMTMKPDDTMLHDVRQDLMRSLRKEKQKQSVWKTIVDAVLDYIQPRYKVALGGIALVAAGIILGYVVPRTTEVPPVKEPTIALANTGFTGPLNEELSVSNLQFVSSDRAHGVVEFTFDAIMPLHMKGRVDDPNIQKVLAHAIVSDRNPGVRLQSVNALASESRKELPDAEVLEALISAMKSDKNPGVRKQAMEILAQYASDQKVKEALLVVLLHDASSGLRIAAINALTQPNNTTIKNDSNLVTILRSTSKNDNNNYIRLRSQAVLKEIKQ
jgi:hypothetical protein